MLSLYADSCKECGSKVSYDSARGESFCRKCGLVQEDKTVDLSAAQNVTRSQLLGSIVSGRRDVNGRQVSRKLVHKLRISQRGIRTHNSSVLNGWRFIGTFCSQEGLPQRVEDCAKTLFTDAHKKNVLRGRSVEEVVPLVLYLACRIEGYPRTVKEIAELTGQDVQLIRSSYKMLVRRLELELEPIDYSRYVPRFASRLHLTQNVQTRTLEILEACNGTFMARGCNPLGVLAAALYIASFMCNEPICQRDVREVIGISGITVRTRVADIMRKLNIDDDVFEVEDSKV